VWLALILISEERRSDNSCDQREKERNALPLEILFPSYFESGSGLRSLTVITQTFGKKPSAVPLP